MSAAFSAPVVKGWCPGLFAPMQAADGWLVRVRPPLGRMTAAQAHLLADVAEQDGNGQISLTNRGNVQLRGFSLEAAHAFPQRMIAAGLGQADPETERRLALQVSPLAGIDPACATETMLCADALRSGLIDHPSLSALPDKFGFCVDGGGFFPTGSLRADIMLQAVESTASSEAGWRVVCGSSCSEPQTVHEGVQIALALAEAFVKRGETQRPLREPAIGKQLFAEIGLRGVSAAGAEMQNGSLLAARAGHLTGSAYAAVAPLGRLTATTLRACAHVAQQGDGVLRMTAWSGLVFAGLKKNPEISGMITHPDDARLRVYACIGAPGCAQAAGDVGRDALVLAPFLPDKADLHVSGCRKGCAHPGAATVTLVAGSEGYGMVLQGTASDEPICILPKTEDVRAFLQALPKGDV
ncbi:precorrin-3B synthase [Acetobacter sp. P5B1]|uniref:precorrin-3B synthase n=1 Tax=Acetobacter sp. P5B1 TaxID=2762620 RepID=UPI001C048F85|nr:precorrin-3B synthase [Acetobacter sp. P5B1]